MPCCAACARCTAGRAAMLRLIEDLIAETRKSVLLCSHLLDDVQRVCRRVVVMHGGTVAEAGTIDQLRRRSAARYVVRWQGAAEEFLTALRSRNVPILACDFAQATATLDLPENFTTTDLFIVARESNVVVVELRAEQEDLEQLFFRVTQGPAVVPIVEHNAHAS